MNRFYALPRWVQYAAVIAASHAVFRLAAEAGYVSTSDRGAVKAGPKLGRS